MSNQSLDLSADVPPEIQDLAQRARGGDKQAQLELGIRFEEGRGIHVDLKRAEALYRRAAADGGPMQIYVPGVGNRPGHVLSLRGAASEGLPAAKVRLAHLREKQSRTQ